MKINAHIDSAEKTSEFVAWLQNETRSAFERSRGAPEELKAAVFLYLHRAYESGLPADEITDLLGVGDQSIMSRASLSKEDEESVLAAFAELDALVEQIHANPLQKAAPSDGDKPSN